jgi:hypothetical protein
MKNGIKCKKKLQHFPYGFPKVLNKFSFLYAQKKTRISFIVGVTNFDMNLFFDRFSFFL